MTSIGLATYKLTYQLSPIFLSGGIAGLAGAKIPIVSITDASSFPDGLLGPGQDLDTDLFFANFEPMPGATLADNEIAHYPFANQAVAANAIITQPLRVSLLMTCPARGNAAFDRKSNVLTSLQTTLAQHISLAGTFDVATPAYLYTNCLLIALRDVTQGQKSQPQSMWQWDFEQPLLTEAQAKTALSVSLQKISGQTKSGAGRASLSGAAANQGTNVSAVAPAVVPAAAPLAGSQSANSTPPLAYPNFGP